MSERGYEKGRWSLADLMPSPDGHEVTEHLSRMEAALADLEGSRNLLDSAMSESDFSRVLRMMEEIGSLSRRLGGYAALWFSEDTHNQDALSFRGRMERTIADARNRALFFELWWKELDDEAATRLIAASGDLAYYLHSLRSFKPYTLSETVEKVINLKDLNGVEALVTLYDMITSEFHYELKIDGKKNSLTRSELTTYAHDPRPELREQAYKELYRVYGEHNTVLGQIYQHIARNWADEEVDLRGFSTPISMRNLRNDIPDEVVDTLLDVCRDNTSLFQRYFRMKAAWLGINRLRRYDIYAPLRSADKEYPFDEAAQTIFSSLSAFSPVLATHAKRVLDEGHLDAEVRTGKCDGAFCYGVLPGLTPWILTSYNDKSDDVFTLAHELGHAVHSLMSAAHSPLTFHSSLPLAETASVFSEILLLEYQLKTESDEDARRDILARFVDSAYATVTRQAYFVLFEREAHALVAAGATIDALADRYLSNLREQFGDAVEVTDEFRWEWLSIPHIYNTPFYCYAYSFGQLLVLALYKRYKEEGDAFVPKFLNILSHGGSKSPQSILAEAEIDITSPAFWQGGFDVLKGMIDELDS